MNTLLELFNFSSPDYLSNLSEGLMVFLVGVATVFSVLIIILLVLSVFNLFSVKGKVKSAPKPAPVVEQPEVSAAASDDAEIVAVIAAAIAAAEADDTAAKFRVVSFKRK